MAVEQHRGHTPADDAQELLRALFDAPPWSPAAQQRSERIPSDDAPALLQALLAAPPGPPLRGSRVILRSLDVRRRRIPTGSAPGDRFDRALHRSQQLLSIGALVVAVYWFLDGPARDWLHERMASAAHTATAPLAIEAGTRAQAAVLPGTRPRRAQPTPEYDFSAPRQGKAEVIRPANPEPTHLLIPAIRVDSPVKVVYIVDGEWEVADYAVGYLYASGLPGDAGNMAMAGHVGLRGGVFRDLGALTAGNDVYVDAASWRYHYRVRESKVVWPNQIEVLDPTPTPTLTMLTCTNWDTQRIVVVADLVGSTPIASLAP
jgi:sortase A